MTLRFDDGAVEMELAGDAAITEQGVSMSDQGDDVLATLPEDTAFAMGVGLSEGWFGEYLDQIERFMGTEGDVDEFLELAESETGLSFPEDIETLLGESTAISIGPDIDPEEFVNSDTPEGLPIGVKIKGDPEAIEDVLDKIRAQMGDQSDILVTESEGDEIAIGADEGYVSDILEDGNLGDSEVFQNVVREAEKADVGRVRQLRRRRRLAGRAGRRGQGSRGQPRAAAGHRHERLDRGRRLARRGPDVTTDCTQRSGPADPVHDRLGDPDQVGRADFQLEPAPPGAHEHRRVVERRTRRPRCDAALLTDRRDPAGDVPCRTLGGGLVRHARATAAERAGQRLQVELPRRPGPPPP